MKCQICNRKLSPDRRLNTKTKDGPCHVSCLIDQTAGLRGRKR